MSEGSEVLVLLVDDHPVVRAGVRGMLADAAGVAVVGETQDGEVGLRAARALRPDVVLMDLSIPRGDGAAATAAIRAELPDTRVVVLTTYDDDRDIERAIAAGASGYLLKDCSTRALLAAIFAAARGESVLAAVARGLNNKEIARELALAEATVKTHLLHAFGKLGVQDRTAAVVRALELRLLPRP